MTELERLARAAIAANESDVIVQWRALDAFERAATPEAVLALIAVVRSERCEMRIVQGGLAP